MGVSEALAGRRSSCTAFFIKMFINLPSTAFSPHSRAFHLSGQPHSDKISENSRRALSLLYAVLVSKIPKRVLLSFSFGGEYTQILICDLFVDFRFVVLRYIQMCTTSLWLNNFAIWQNPG